ncbi:MAG: hypothetical protein ACRC5C_05500 [Bacilli bacterium]
MGRFGMKVAVVLLGVLIMLILLNAFVKESYDYNIDKAIRKFKANPYPVDIINLGASHSMYGFYFKPTGLAHLDLALPAQTIAYDYKLLQTYGEHLKPGGVVIVSISQITFVNEQVDNFGDYYRILDRSALGDVNPLHYYSYLYFPGTNRVQLISAIAEKFKEFRWDAHKPWTNGGLRYSERKLEKVEGFAEAAQKNDSVANNMAQLREIVAYCQEKGYRVVFTIEPVHRSYHEYFTEDVMDKLVFQHLEALNLDVPVLNYMSDERFMDEERYFLDPDHLNRDGRKKYSWIVYHELKEMGYL